MPGKGDFGSATAGNAGQGMYTPGDNSWKAWSEGWDYRYTGDGVTNPITNNPFTQAERPDEYQAWNDGYNEAAAATATTRRMPHSEGAAPTPP